ncbi:hypothetical protein, partial [Micromonospora echinofusca]
MGLTDTGDGLVDGPATLPRIEQPPAWRTRRGYHRPERDLLTKVATGEWLEFAAEEGPDLTVMRDWGPERTVRAGVLYQVLADPDGPPVHAKGLRLRGVRITGPLNLEYAQLRCPLILDACYLDAPEPVNLHGAKVPGLAMTRCYLTTGLAAEGIEVKQGIDLTGSVLHGPLILSGADITGRLDCSGAQLKGRDDSGNALVADDLKVSAGIQCNDGFTAAGAVRLNSADIAGNVDFTEARLAGRNDEGVALWADGIRVKGSLLFERLIVTAGAVRMVGADIAVQLNCPGAKLAGRDDDGIAFAIDFIKVGAGLFLNGDFVAEGTVCLSEANVTGDIVGAGARFAATQGYALVAMRIRVEGNINLGETQIVGGAVNIRGADIKGSLSLSSAKILGRDDDGDALVADFSSIGSGAFLRNVVVGGGLRLAEAGLVGDLDLSGGHFESARGAAVFGARLKVDGDLLLTGGIVESGCVDLVGAEIRGMLRCTNVKFSGSNQDGAALVGRQMRLGGDLLLDGNCVAHGQVDLYEMQVAGDVKFGGVTIGSITGCALDVGRARV